LPPRKGTGLGLAICKQVAEAHGGHIRLAASGPDGSTFELELPR
jgi:signal transduction histidine kinase